MDDRIRLRHAMGARIDVPIRSRWALLHGYADQHHPFAVDWRRFGPFLREDTP